MERRLNMRRMHAKRAPIKMKLEPRPSRFSGGNMETVRDELNIMKLVSESVKNFDDLFKQEKLSSFRYVTAWTRAEKKCSAIFDTLGEHQKKFVTDILPKRLPDELKTKAHCLPIAVWVCGADWNGFFTEFNKKTEQLFSGEEKWENFRFKSFYILLTFAIKCLPSKPNRSMMNMIFRGMDLKEAPEEGKIFCFGKFGSFTTCAPLAHGKQMMTMHPSQVEEKVVSGAVDHKFILRVVFGPNLNALGMGHLSPYGRKEMEVLVAPQQAFRVRKIIKRENKGISIVILQPVKRFF